MVELEPMICCVDLEPIALKMRTSPGSAFIVKLPSGIVCVLTALPLILTVTFDRDVPSDALVTLPEIVFVCAHKLVDNITPEQNKSNFLFIIII
ncbi:hypothetical protein D3C72_1900570 [compost metagenome]